MNDTHIHWHRHERKYADLDPSLIPKAESLQDTIDRWELFQDQGMHLCFNDKEKLKWLWVNQWFGRSSSSFSIKLALSLLTFSYLIILKCDPFLIPCLWPPEPFLYGKVKSKPTWWRVGMSWSLPMPTVSEVKTQKHPSLLPLNSTPPMSNKCFDLISSV